MVRLLILDRTNYDWRLDSLCYLINKNSFISLVTTWFIWSQLEISILNFKNFREISLYMYKATRVTYLTWVFLLYSIWEYGTSNRVIHSLLKLAKNASTPDTRQERMAPLTYSMWASIDCEFDSLFMWCSMLFKYLMHFVVLVLHRK